MLAPACGLTRAFEPHAQGHWNADADGVPAGTRGAAKSRCRTGTRRLVRSITVAVAAASPVPTQKTAVGAAAADRTDSDRASDKSRAEAMIVTVTVTANSSWKAAVGGAGPQRLRVTRRRTT